ncbi:MAG TPA: Uma2 family endonuclease, partial [Chloroflexota bacterium]|nr:Uma2 family endonuclease [Chloroflexota bacterium]
FAHVDPEKMIRIMPDLIVEVLSPGTDEHDLFTKRNLYEQLGVPHYWIADAQAKSIREYVLQKDQRYVEHVFSEDQPFEPALFPGMKLDLRRLFA